MTATSRDNPLWTKVSVPIFNHIKIFLLRFYIADIFQQFKSKLAIEVHRYSRQLPSHVVASEIEDLRVIAQLELIETIKVWDKSINDDIWPLARRRILGAMKDHIRFITRTDPSRLYDWVAEATYMYEVVEANDSFSQKIENSIQLHQIMQSLGLREKRVVDAHVRLDLTFKEIGLVIGVSESQSSRIYKQAIEKMKKVIQEGT